jgi:hypothetical protein
MFKRHDHSGLRLSGRHISEKSQETTENGSLPHVKYTDLHFSRPILVLSFYNFSSTWKCICRIDCVKELVAAHKTAEYTRLNYETYTTS